MHSTLPLKDRTGMPHRRRATPLGSEDRALVWLHRLAVQRRAGVNRPVAAVAEDHHVRWIERPIRRDIDRYHVMDLRRQERVASLADAVRPP